MTLLRRATSRVDIASFYWTLRGKDIHVDPSDWQVSSVCVAVCVRVTVRVCVCAYECRCMCGACVRAYGCVRVGIRVLSDNPQRIPTMNRTRGGSDESGSLVIFHTEEEHRNRLTQWRFLMGRSAPKLRPQALNVVGASALSCHVCGPYLRPRLCSSGHVRFTSCPDSGSLAEDWISCSLFRKKTSDVEEDVERVRSD